MRFDKFTIKMQEAIQAAQEMAGDLGHSEINAAHVLLSTLEQPEGIVRPMLERVGVPAGTVEAKVREWLNRQPTVSGAVQSQANLGNELNGVLKAAEKEMKVLKDEYLSVEHFLLGLVKSKSPVTDILKELGVNYQALVQAVNAVRGSQRVTDQDPEGKYQSLEKYGNDLTARAQEGKIDPVIGRDDEIRRIMQVLSRRTKNNPVLIGDPGVGKTAIVEGLARRIVSGDVPDGLKDKRGSSESVHQ